MSSLDKRFTELADKVSEGMGTWQVLGVSIAAVLVWLLSGPFFHFSDTWQLLVNTPTTIIELWIGFLLAAAANRAQRKLEELLKQIETTVEHDEAVEEKLVELINENTELTREIHRLAKILAGEGKPHG